MSENDHMRADKFLWAVRLFKTRAIAAENCSKGKVSIQGIHIKPSRIMKSGEIFTISKLPVIYSYLIKNFPKSRISASLVPGFIEDKTPPEEIKKLDLQESFFVKRDKGSGRPTKKERRVIDKLRDF